MWNTRLIRKNFVRNLVWGVNPFITRKEKIPGWYRLTICSYLFWISPRMYNSQWHSQLSHLLHSGNVGLWELAVKLVISEGCRMTTCLCKILCLAPLSEWLGIVIHPALPRVWIPRYHLVSLGDFSVFLSAIQNLIHTLFAVHGNLEMNQ